MGLTSLLRTVSEELRAPAVVAEAIYDVEARERVVRRRTIAGYAVVVVAISLGYFAFVSTRSELASSPLTYAAGSAVLALVLVVIALRLGRDTVAAVVALAMPLVLAFGLSWQFSADVAAPALGAVSILGAFVILGERNVAARFAVLAVGVVSVSANQLIFSRVDPLTPLPEHLLEGAARANRAYMALGLVFMLTLLHRRLVVARETADGALKKSLELAGTDQLTGLPNRRPVMARLQELGNVPPSGTVVALADLDRFKDFNDDYGHSCGDAVLKSIAKLLETGVRNQDMVARWGGEEFLLILNGVSTREATRILDRLRFAVEQRATFCGQHEHHVTVSIGLADADGVETIDECLRRADASLYSAKAGGRNRVTVAA